MRLNLHTQHSNLSILKFHLVMLRIYLHGIEITGDRMSCAGCLQLDLDNVKGIITDDLRRVHSVCGAPLHLTRFPVEDFRLSPVLILEALPARLQVNEHSVLRVLVEFSLYMWLFEGANHLYLVILKEGGRRLHRDRHERRATNQQSGVYFDFHTCLPKL